MKGTRHSHALRRLLLAVLGVACLAAGCGSRPAATHPKKRLVVEVYGSPVPIATCWPEAYHVNGRWIPVEDYEGLARLLRPFSAQLELGQPDFSFVIVAVL